MVNGQNIGLTDRLGFLRSVASELKQVEFHLPVTIDLYHEARRRNRRWAHDRLAFNPSYTNCRDNRLRIEKATGHDGHWDYGLELEKLFLCVDTNPCFAVYFVRSNDETVLVIAAACMDPGKAVAFGELIDVLDATERRNWGFHKNPFSSHVSGTRTHLSLIKQAAIAALDKRRPKEMESLHDRFDHAIVLVQASQEEDKLYDLACWLRKNTQSAPNTIIEYIETVFARGTTGA
jgi:hypothetical protein